MVEFKIYGRPLNLIFNILEIIPLVSSWALLENAIKLMHQRSLSQANCSSVNGVKCLKWSLRQNHLLSDVFA